MSSITDKPILLKSEDLLKVEKYSLALSNFITRSDTPITVGLHDRTISKVFKNPTFKRFKEDNKVYFEAEEDTTSKILGNNITNWEYQITWTYSKDVERLSKSNL